MNATTPESSPASFPPIRYGLRFKVLAGLTAFNVAVTLLFTVNHYALEKEHIMANLRERLGGYADAIPTLLPAGYLARANAADAISDADYRAVVERLNRYCTSVGLRFLYTYAKGERGFYCTATNCPPNERFTPYWDFYDTAPPEIQQAWTTGKPVYAVVTDKWGRTFTVFAPQRTPEGRRYIAGADLPIAFVDGLLRQTLRQSLYVGAGSFVLFFAISAYVSTRFSRQITRLAAYTRELVRANFRPEAQSPLRQEVLAIPTQRADEVGELAHSFLVMEEQLGTYLHRLQAETAARERAENELRIAGEIQLSMLPHTFPTADRIDLHAAMKPAKEAGGDYYDCFFLDPEHLCFSIGDVSDKGMPAALFMAVALTTLRAKATPDLVDAPEEILRQTNALLIPQNQACQFVTMFLGVLDVRSGLITFSDGGHNRPYHCSARTGAQMLSLPPREGIALGVMPEAAFKRHTLQLEPGDALFLYTDGVTEAIAADDTFYREPRLQKVLSAIPPSAVARQWVETVMADVFDFARGHVQADDITTLAVRLKNSS